MSKFTPGPWVTNTAGSAKRGEPFKITEIYVYAPKTQDDTAICGDVIDPVTQEPSEANAQLIAAAPALYEALEDLLADIENYQTINLLNGYNNVSQINARAALSLVGGGES